MVESNIIESYLWSEIFPSNVLAHTIPIAIVIIVFRLISRIKKLRVARAFVYFGKAIAYLYVIIMLHAFFKENGCAINSINVFTGFTYMFSFIELIDNICLAIEEIKNSKVLDGNYEYKMLVEEEQHIESIYKTLSTIEGMLEVGSASESLKDNIKIFKEMVNNSNFIWVDQILKPINNGEYNFGKMFSDILMSKIFSDVIRNAETLTIDEEQSKELGDLLRKANHIYSIYQEEKIRLKEEYERMKMISE